MVRVGGGDASRTARKHSAAAMRSTRGAFDRFDAGSVIVTFAKTDCCSGGALVHFTVKIRSMLTLET